VPPSPTATPTAIRVEGLSKSYGPVQALRGIDLSVVRGEMFGLLGPNGAGKTTLIEILEGLRQADSGRVSVLGRSPWPRDPALGLRIGVQTQSSAFFVRLTAREHLETVAALYGLGRDAARRVAGRFGVDAWANTRVERLSGGQRQRLALASALVHDPDLLFLDEPTAALDPQARRDLWSLLREVRDQGKTIVYTTHQMDEAEALCDRVAIINDGAVVACGHPRDLVEGLDEPVRVMVPDGRITLGEARALAGVDNAASAGGCVVLATRTPGLVLSAVADLAGAHGVSTRSATLEDVYLKLTGTEYQP
jgi:ABC-2 type transport system ATP-binding protein